MFNSRPNQPGRPSSTSFFMDQLLKNQQAHQKSLHDKNPWNRYEDFGKTRENESYKRTTDFNGDTVLKKEASISVVNLISGKEKTWIHETGEQIRVKNNDNQTTFDKERSFQFGSKPTTLPTNERMTKTDNAEHKSTTFQLSKINTNPFTGQKQVENDPTKIISRDTTPLADRMLENAAKIAESDQNSPGAIGAILLRNLKKIENQTTTTAETTTHAFGHQHKKVDPVKYVETTPQPSFLGASQPKTEKVTNIMGSEMRQPNDRSGCSIM